MIRHFVYNTKKKKNKRESITFRIFPVQFEISMAGLWLLAEPSINGQAHDLAKYSLNAGDEIYLVILDLSIRFSE